MSSLQPVTPEILGHALPVAQPDYLPYSAWVGHLPFASWLVDVLKPGVLVELGVHNGGSYCAFCEAVARHGLPTACFGVDSWVGDPHAGHYGGEVLADLQAYHDPRYGAFSRLVRSTFDEALEHFADGSVDLLHIDGFHTYEAVRHDFESWRRKLSDRAVVLFHDTNVREGSFGVWRFWEEVRQEWPHFEFLHGHGLGVLGVGSEQPEALRRLFAASDAETAAIRSVFGQLGQRLVDLRDLQRTNETQETQLANQNSTLIERQDYIDKQISETSALRDEVGKYHEALVRANADRDQNLVDIAGLKAEIQGRDADLSDRDELLQKRLAEIQHLRRLLREQDTNLGRLARQLSERDLQMSARDEQIRRFVKSVRRSRSWRLTGPFRRAGLFGRREKNLLKRYSKNHLSGAISPASASDHISDLQALFDREWYLIHYPDVAAANIDPWQHYTNIGVKELRDPNPFFSSGWYLKRYEDVAAQGLDPFAHYVTSGAAELRDPHPEFDAIFYVEEHPDARANPLAHHLKFGIREGWPTKRRLDIEKYLPSVSRIPTPPSSVEVDIIIPVYRGLDETRRCLETVLADADRPQGRVIVIDDCSPEPELSAWLKEVAAAGRIDLLRNEQNLGFVATVNRGMAVAGRRDVVLLNSDTEVPQGWLARLAGHAHADKGIGTVTPFSNNATVCSYPVIEGGPLPFGCSVEDVDIACRSANAGRTVEIPTAVGFAMYIRRDCIDEVGPFDVETFGTGYGEEVDFCLRASNRGWRHILACDTFVYHAGEVSFGKNSPKRENAWNVLCRLYPQYPKDVERHIRRAEADPYRFAITAAIFRAMAHPSILIVAHALGGGTERHVQEVLRSIDRKANVLMLQPFGGNVILSFPLASDHPKLTVSSDAVEDLVIFLKSCELDRIHVQHWHGMEMDLRHLIHELGVPFDVTVHDYFAICPQINMIPEPGGGFCGEPDMAACNACISARPSHGARDILSWRRSWDWLFTEADRVICPSQDVKDRLARYGLADRCIVVHHEPVRDSNWPLAVLSLAPKEPLRIAILGRLAEHKGAGALRACLPYSNRNGLEFIIIGSRETDFPLPHGAELTETGAYEEKDLARLIGEMRPHLLWFPAPWPETYSYTLSAAIDAGLPIVAADLGALPERLSGRPWTWLVPARAEATAWLEAFASVRHALLEGRSPISGLPRAIDKDFYPDAYLMPARKAPEAPSSELVDLRREGTIAVLAVPEVQADGSFSPCAYIRLLLPFDHLAANGGVTLTVATPEEALRYRADVIVTQRYAISSGLEADRLIEHCARHEMRLLYDLDDNLVDIPDEHPEAEVLQPRAQIVLQLLTSADIVWVSTEPLKNDLQRFRQDIEIMPNGLDERIWISTSSPDRRGGDPIRILYMGTATHDGDLAFIAPAVRRLKEEYGSSISVEVIGVTTRLDLPYGMMRIVPPPSASRSYPAFVDWFVRNGRWDIGMAPLLDSQFNRCKSAIKAMDYMGIGLSVVVSDVAPYEDVPSDAVTRVSNDPDAWYSAVAELVRDGHRRESCAKMGRRRFGELYTLSAQERMRRAALARALAKPFRALHRRIATEAAK